MFTELARLLLDDDHGITLEAYRSLCNTASKYADSIDYEFFLDLTAKYCRAINGRIYMNEIK